MISNDCRCPGCGQCEASMREPLLDAYVDELEKATKDFYNAWMMDETSETIVEKAQILRAVIKKGRP